MDTQPVFQALSDPTRRKILSLLRNKPMRSGEIAQQFEMSWPSVARHLGVLSGAGLITAKKEGSSVAYSIEPSPLEAAFAELTTLAGEAKDEDERFTFFERYNEHARQAISAAQQEARDLRHAQVDVGHLVLGLLDAPDGEAARTLDRAGLRAQQLRDVVVALYPQDDAAALPPFSPTVKRVMEQALVVAGRVGHVYAGSGPLLLALLEEMADAQPDAVWASIVAAFGVDPELLHRDVTERLKGYEETRPQGTGMFERFTDRARRVVVLSQEEARHLKHPHIDTEHTLLGLIGEGEGIAATVLKEWVTLEHARELVLARRPSGELEPAGHIPFTVENKKVLELSLREALRLGHNYISTEHILLGLLREGEGVGAQVIAQDLKLRLEIVRDQVLAMMGGVASESRAVVSPAVAELDRKIAELRAEKDAAIERQDFVEATKIREREKKLQHERDERVAGERLAGRMVEPSGEPAVGRQRALEDVVREVLARLTDIEKRLGGTGAS